MVYSDTIHQSLIDPAYENEVFRARHGYKELHQHMPPERRNRDFKPVNYGSFRGILNFKVSEPFSMLKNLKDLKEEKHNHPIKWAKMFIKGAIFGSMIGTLYFMVKPSQAFPMRKLLQASGERPWSGRYFRYYKQVVPIYAIYGGALFSGYQLIMDYFEHHETNKDRPKFVNHMIATVLLSSTASALYAGTVTSVATGFVASVFLIGPMSWWLYKSAQLNGHGVRPANMFYENGVTPEEVERIQALDQLESVAYQMNTTPGYGYISRNQSHL
eukprot:403372309